MLVVVAWRVAPLIRQVRQERRAVGQVVVVGQHKTRPLVMLGKMVDSQVVEVAAVAAEHQRAAQAVLVALERVGCSHGKEATDHAAVRKPYRVPQGQVAS